MPRPRRRPWQHDSDQTASGKAGAVHIRDSGRPCENLEAGTAHDRCGAIYDYTKEEWAFWWERHAEILSGKTTAT